MEHLTAARRAFRRGRPVALVGAAGASDGVLALAAQPVTAQALAHMIRLTSGFVCAAMAEDRANYLGIPLQSSDPGALRAYGVTVDSAEGISTGISAADRAHTLRMLADPQAKPEDFRRPGHVVPVRVRRHAPPEELDYARAALDLATLCELMPVAAVAAVTSGSDPRRMADEDELREIALAHRLVVLDIRTLRQAGDALRTDPARSA